MLKKKKTYKPSAFVGPTVTGPVQDPLAVINLDNRLYIYDRFTIYPDR